MNDKEDLIDRLTVLDDMYSDRGIVSIAAREYYYAHYATLEERREMNREDKIQFVFAVCFVSAALGFPIVYGLIHLIFWILGGL